MATRVPDQVYREQKGGEHEATLDCIGNRRDWPWPPWWWKFVFSVSEPEKFLPQLPYNERSQCNQGLAIPLQAAFSTQTCLSSCQPSIRRI